MTQQEHKTIHIHHITDNIPRLDEADDFGFRSLVKRVILSPVGFSSDSGGASVVWSSEFIMTNKRKETK